jgi:predicted RNA binding protein YcfA (HicA-like mRNA interferase family)
LSISWLIFVRDTRAKSTIGQVDLPMFLCIYLHNESHFVPTFETNTRRIVARLEREGWANSGGGSHDIYKHPQMPGRIVVPRHKEQSLGVAHSIAGIAGWI